MIELSGSSSDILHRPLPVDDPEQRRPDITLARARLGWEPEANLEAGLRMTIAHSRNELEQGRIE